VSRKRVVASLTLLVVLVTLGPGHSLPAVGREAARPDPVMTELALVRQALVMGDTDDAVRLSEDLYRRHPDDDRVFWSLVKTYKAAGLEEERSLPLLEARLTQTPDDDRVRMELGEAYARQADFDRAHAVWLDRARQGRADVVRYSEVGALEVRYRMYEQAREVYLEGRRISGNDVFFSEELAQVYTILGQYEEAIDECFVTARAHSGMDQWAANRIEQMLDGGADERMVRRASGRGRMLMEFAEILRGEGLTREAREAYRLVVDRNPGTVNAGVSGIFGARLLVELGRTRQAVSELESLTEVMSDHPIKSEALLEKAGIELEHLGDADAAIATLDRIPDDADFRSRSVREDVDLLRIDALLALGRLEPAAEQARDLLTGRPRDETRQRARYYLGYVAFLNLDLEECLTELRALVEEDPSGTLVNDALRLMLVVSDAQESGDVVPLRHLAEAHSAVLSGRNRAAAEQLEALIETAGLLPVASEALMLLGDVLEASGDLDGALRAYGRATREERTLATRAEARMRRAEIFHDRLGRPGEALAEYVALIEELPSNFLTGEARRRAEAIRREEGVRG